MNIADYHAMKDYYRGGTRKLHWNNSDMMLIWIMERRRNKMNVKLKPCPFCGGRAHIEDISEPDDMGPIWMILCKKCGASASFGMDGCDATQVETVDSWNRRAEK